MTFLRRGCKTFPNIGLTYRLENSTTSKQPIRIRITRNIPRDVRLLTAFVRSNGDGHENTHETKAKAWTKQHEIKKETRKDSCNCCGYGMEILYVKFAFLKESSWHLTIDRCFITGWFTIETIYYILLFVTIIIIIILRKRSYKINLLKKKRLEVLSILFDVMIYHVIIKSQQLPISITV